MFEYQTILAILDLASLLSDTVQESLFPSSRSDPNCELAYLELFYHPIPTLQSLLRRALKIDW